MIIGPPMSGKEAISNRMMYHGAIENENAVIKVTTRQPAVNIIEMFKENNQNISLSRVGFVDCVSKVLGETVEIGNIKLVNSPRDLTGMGVKINQFFEDFSKKNIQKIQLHIDSLSTMLMYSDIQTVFRFMHVFTTRIKATGALGIFVVNSRMHDERIIASLKQLCDGMIEVKSENDRNFFRTAGLLPKPTPWLEYEVDGVNGITVK